MTSILMVGLFALAVIGLLALPIVVFNWLMKRNTGYDTKFHIRDDTSRKLDADFLVRPNDNRSQTARKAKRRKSQATPHYDRLHAMDKAQQRAEQAEQRLKETIEDNSDPIPLGDLLESENKSQSG